jgi:hypothetical protein
LAQRVHPATSHLLRKLKLHLVIAVWTVVNRNVQCLSILWTVLQLRPTCHAARCFVKPPPRQYHKSPKAHRTILRPWLVLIMLSDGGMTSSPIVSRRPIYSPVVAAYVPSLRLVGSQCNVPSELARSWILKRPNSRQLHSSGHYSLRKGTITL